MPGVGATDTLRLPLTAYPIFRSSQLALIAFVIGIPEHLVLELYVQDARFGLWDSLLDSHSHRTLSPSSAVEST